MTFLKSQMPISTFYSLLCLIRILDTLMYYVSLPPKLFGFFGAQRSQGIFWGWCISSSYLSSLWLFGTSFGTDLIFSNFYISFYLGLITTPHVLYVHMTYEQFLFLCFIPHTITWPREVINRIIIFFMTFGVLLYGRTPTLILFYILHNPTTPILPVYFEQRRSHLEKDTTRPRSMVIRKISTIPRRTLVAPD